MLQGRSERGGQDPHPPPSPQPRMKTSLFMTCIIQHCACIRDAKKSNVNISEDRIEENFIKRFLKQNSSVSGRRSVNSHCIAFIHPELIEINRCSGLTSVIFRWCRLAYSSTNSVCPRQVSNFCGLDKSTIPPVYLQLSATLYRPSWASVHNTFFLSVFSLPLYIFRWSRSVTTTVNKSQRRQAFACRRF